VDPASYLGKDHELALALPNLLVQRPHALLVGLSKIVVVPHRPIILPSDGKIFATRDPERKAF